MKVLHTHVINKKNSGDFLIGAATKEYLEILLNKKCKFDTVNCRKKVYNITVDNINSYDLLLVGAGGLFLPDNRAASKSVSGWQWNISYENLQKINIPIFVISIGYNTFFQQTMGMNNMENSIVNEKRFNLFKKNVKLLVEKSEYFSMRHKNDIELLVNDIGEKYRSKIKFDFCPTIEYTRNKQLYSTGKYIAFEIKDDRMWRRTYNIGIDKYYTELENTIKYLLHIGEKVVFLSHDGSKNFYNYLLKKKLKIGFVDNSCANEDEIYKNYCKIKTLVATAGHSQMIASAIVGIKVISLVTHPKILNFCLDTDNTNFIEPNKNLNFSSELIKKIL